MTRNLRNGLVGLGTVMCLSAPVAAGPTTFESFESCAAAQQAVREAGSSGLATNQPFYAVVFDEPQCYRDAAGRFTSYEEIREIAGEQCRIGYVCVDDIPSSFD